MPHLRRPVARALCATAALAAAACSANPSSSTSPTTTSTASRQPTTTVGAPVTASDPAQPVHVGLGQSFNLSVDVDPTKDARWQVDTYDQAAVFYLGEAPGQTNPAPGTLPTDLLAFRADKAGTTKVVLRFGAPGPGTPADPRVTFTIEVR